LGRETYYLVIEDSFTQFGDRVMYREEQISAKHLLAPLAQNMTETKCQSRSGEATKNTQNTVGEKADLRQEETLECQSGVCLVTWKPQRPAA
jgi:hypothetical protein